MSEHLDQPQFLILEPTEVAAAETLAEGALQFSMNDSADWIVDMGARYERFAITRRVSPQGSHFIMGLKIEGSNDNDPITITRYSLDADRRYFMVIPEYYENFDHYERSLADKTPEADTLLMEMGAFLPDLDDWSDFKGLLETAYVRGEVQQMNLELAQRMGSAALEHPHPSTEPDVS